MNFIFWFVVLIGVGYLWRRRGWFSKIRKQYSRRKTTLNGNKGCLYNKKNDNDALEGNGYCNNFYSENKESFFWLMIKRGIKFYRKEYLTTITEKKYYDKLVSWFGEKCYIHCQVSLGSLFIFPKQKIFTDEEQKRFFSVCNRMSLDFVLTSKTNNNIICIIELDDESHNREDRKKRDDMLNYLMTETNMPFLRVSVDSMKNKPPVWDVYDKSK